MCVSLQYSYWLHNFSISEFFTMIFVTECAENPVNFFGLTRVLNQIKVSLGNKMIVTFKKIE